MTYKEFSSIIKKCTKYNNKIYNKWNNEWQIQYEKFGYDLPYPLKDIEEIVEDYDNIKNDMIGSIKQEIYCTYYHDYCWAIDRIYKDIIHMKYLTTPEIGDIGLVFDILKNILWLMVEKKRNKYFDYYVLRASRKVYNRLVFGLYSDIENLDVKEECKLEHLLDLNYHLENFLKWCPNDPEIAKACNTLKDYL